MNGKAEPLPCVRMTVMTSPQESPPVSPCPQVRQLESYHFSCGMFVFPLFNNPEILQLLIRNVVSFPTLSVSPLCGFILFSSVPKYAVISPILKPKPKPSWIPRTLQLPPFSLLLFRTRLSETVNPAFSLLPVYPFSPKGTTFRCILPPPKHTHTHTRTHPLDLLSRSPVTSLPAVLSICNLSAAYSPRTTVSALASGFFSHPAPPQFLCWFSILLSSWMYWLLSGSLFPLNTIPRRSRSVLWLFNSILEPFLSL